MESDRDRLIRERAYALWEQRGRPSGTAEEDWLEAEQSFAGGSENPLVDEASSGATEASSSKPRKPSVPKEPAAKAAKPKASPDVPGAAASAGAEPSAKRASSKSPAKGSRP